MTDAWIISIIFLIVVFLLRQGNVNIQLVIKSFFPVIFANNWYVTCYILFLLIYPFLNNVIYDAKQNTLLKCVLILCALYIFANFIKANLFCFTNLMAWIAIYFFMGYAKRFLKELFNNRKINAAFVLVGSAGNFALVFITNFLGLHISFFQNKLQYWYTDNGTCNPFIILAAIGLFNFARQWKFKNKIINWISSLSLLIYIIHANLMMKSYYNPLYYGFIHETFGYNYIVLWVLLFTVILFVGSTVVASLYKVTIQKLALKFCSWSFPYLQNAYDKVEKQLLKIK